MNDKIMSGNVEIIGPFWPEYRLSVGGFEVPHLRVRPPMDAQKEPAPLEDERIYVSCDNRIGLYTSRDELTRWLPFLADCMAVSAGYPCHGAQDKLSPFTRKLTELQIETGPKPDLHIVRD
jgi:hypothetical protein